MTTSNSTICNQRTGGWPDNLIIEDLRNILVIIIVVTIDDDAGRLMVIAQLGVQGVSKLLTDDESFDWKIVSTPTTVHTH